MSRENVETIQRVFDAFGRGDIATIVDNVSDDTVWGFNVSCSDVPWHAQVRGKQHVPDFFEALLGNVDFTTFEPRDFIDAGDSVVAHVHVGYVVKKTGRPVNEDVLMWWRVGPDGKISQLIHFEDTAQVINAYRG
jgi:ketosteroid isomerase-like protein